MYNCTQWTKQTQEQLIGKMVRRGRSRRIIVGTYVDIVGGVRLDRPLEGFVSWNLDELTYCD